jgi:protein-S-isoprenylcysteine O-methyltransferase Ste14
MLFLKSVLFTMIVPGTVTIVIPYFIVLQGSAVNLGHWTAQQLLGLIAILLGTAILLRCVWDFASVGRGTLAPIDPPKKLVVQGLYRYVRNPMYVGVLVLLLGEAAFFQSAALARYAAGWLVVVHLVVVLYEEPVLRRRFGESYDRYCRSVGRWLPGKRFEQAAQPSHPADPPPKAAARG